MKKTLAILLALLAAASISLAACDEDDERTPIGGGNGDDIEQVEDSDDEVTEDTKDNNNEDTNDQGGNNDVVTDYVTKNDTVYAGYNVWLRASDYTGADKVNSVTAKQALERIATNGEWDKVKDPKSGKECYILHAWVSENSDNFTFTELEESEQVSLTLSTSADVGNICFFETPHYAWNDSANGYYYDNIILKSGITHANLSKDYKLTKVAYNANWLKVEFVGTITTSGGTKTCTEENPGVFYTRTYFVDKGRIIDPSASTGGNGGNIAG